VRVAEVQINQLPVIRAAALDALLLDARAGADFSAERFSFDGFGVIAAGQLRMANVAPLALNGHAALRPAAEGDSPRWGAVLDASGSLAELKLGTLLRGRPVPGRDAPALDAQATLRPLYRWWLAALKLQTQALDLAALAAGAPTTQLSGTAEMSSLVADKPLVANIQLDNAAPGRWDEQRVPMQKLSVQAQGELQRPDRLDFSRLDLLLADSKGGAGRVTGNASWQGHELTLDTVLTQVTPQRLDTRAAAMTISGPIQAKLRGLPSPDLNANTASATGATSAPSKTAPAAAKPAPATPAFSADWKLDLKGQLDTRPQPVQLQMQASLDAQRLHIENARAQAGAAVAEVQGNIIRLPAGAWQVQTTGNLRDFDPQPWWPGDSNPAWRQGPHRLSGQWQFDLRLPAGTAQLAPPAVLQRLSGNGTLNLRDSLLAGVPMAADVTVSNLGPDASAAATATAASSSASGTMTAGAVTTVTTATTVAASVRLAGNELQLEGRGDPLGNGEADRWRLELRADACTLTWPTGCRVAAARRWPWRLKAAGRACVATARRVWRNCNWAC
jgi:translocation and assembly module TamB